jgi:hypothetical protein
MHALKIISASHANSVHKYIDTELKLLNCNSNNKILLEQNLTPKYAQTKVKESMCE